MFDSIKKRFPNRIPTSQYNQWPQCKACAKTGMQWTKVTDTWHPMLCFVCGGSGVRKPKAA